jgi:GDPmannose 4,6-dehydratase
LDAKRDWGHARDYVEAQWLMLQQDKPKDYVIASGIQYSVRDFVNVAARKVNLNLSWQGKGINEKAYDQNGNCIIEVDSRYFRPAEVEELLGDSTLARNELGWQPKTSFDELVSEMMDKDIKDAEDFLILNKKKEK